MLTTPPMPRIELETVDQAVERLFTYLAELANADSFPLSKDGQMPREITDRWLEVHHISYLMLKRAALHHGLLLTEKIAGVYIFSLDWETF